MTYLQKLADLQQKSKPDQEGYKNLKSRLSFLTPETDIDVIQKLIKEIHAYNPMQQNELLRLIKLRTNITLSAMKSFSSIEEERPDHIALAREVITSINAKNIICTDEGCFYWSDEGVWRLLKEREIKQIVQKHLDKTDCFTSRALVDNVTDVLKTETYSPHQEWNNKKDIINFTNGEAQWVKGAWVLRGHTRENYLTSQVPHSYDENALAPRFKRFLKEIFEPDRDGNEKGQLILELMGYTLASHAKYEKFSLLVGKGANGKSVLLDVIYNMVGRQNAAAVQPSQFSNKFQRAHLHMKLANLVTEMAEGLEIADAELKSIVSGEVTTVEKKFQEPLEISPYATCWFGTNHLPHTRDFSDALFRRAAVISFNRKFTEGVDADPNLKNTLLQEIPGIINLALQAYGRVILRNGFSEPESCKNAKNEWRLEADQVAQFVNEVCNSDSNSKTLSHDLYERYQSWAMRSGIQKRVSHKSFSQRLEKLGYVLCKGTDGIRLIAGIRFKNICDEAIDCLS